MNKRTEELVEKSMSVFEKTASISDYAPAIGALLGAGAGVGRRLLKGDEDGEEARLRSLLGDALIGGALGAGAGIGVSKLAPMREVDVSRAMENIKKSKDVATEHVGEPSQDVEAVEPGRFDNYWGGV